MTITNKVLKVTKIHEPSRNNTNGGKYQACL